MSGIIRNASVPQTYIKNTALDIYPPIIIISDEASVTVTLQLPSSSTGTFNTSTVGGVTSTFDGEMWHVSGAKANVNELLAALVFTPANNHVSTFGIIVTLIYEEDMFISSTTKMMTGIDTPVAGPTVGDTMSATTLDITTLDDWATLAANTSWVTADKTVRLMNNITFTTAPATLTISDGKFDGCGYTIMLAYESSTHVPLMDVAGGTVCNVAVTNLFDTLGLVDSSSVAVLCTTGSWGTFRRLRFTGNALRASVVTTGVNNKTTTISNVSFEGAITLSNSGGIFGTTGVTLEQYNNYVGVTTTFNIRNCTAHATFCHASYSAAIGYAFAGGDNTCVFTNDMTRCHASIGVEYPMYDDENTAGCLLSVACAGEVSQCYCISNADYVSCVHIVISNTSPILIKNIYFNAGGKQNTLVCIAVEAANLTNVYMVSTNLFPDNCLIRASYTNVQLTNVYKSSHLNLVPDGGVTGSAGDVALLEGEAGANLLNSVP